jgi:peptidyl-prolyl cis-trans isomerase C
MKTSRLFEILSAGALAALVVASPAFGFPSSGAPAKEPAAAEDGPKMDPATPVAVVNGNPIIRRDYDRALSGQMQALQRMQGGMHGQVNQPNEQIKKSVLDRLVAEELLYEESLNFPVENAEVQVQEMYEQSKASAPSPEAFQQAMKAQGLTEKGVKELIGRRVSVRHYVDTQIRPGVAVTEEDVAKFYEENPDKFTVAEPMTKASHILIKVPADAEAETKDAAKKKTEALQARAASGEDFAILARENSEGPSAPRGGDLGFFTRARMVKPFADAAFALDVGSVSEVVETQFGYHVIKVTDRMEAGPQSYDRIKDQVEAQLANAALNNAVQAKILELRSTAKIDVVAPHL